MLVAATDFKTSDYRAMVDEVRPTLPDARAGRVPRHRRLGRRCWPAADDGRRRRAGASARPTLGLDDPINIQYTSGTTGFPKGATLSHHNILNNGYFVGEGCGYTEADRVCIPVPFYHCFGMVLGNLGVHHPRRHDGGPGAGVRPARHARRPSQAERCTSLYGVPTMFIAELGHPDFDRLRPVVAAHRDHGRLAVPGRGDEAVRRRRCTWTR